jgi:hypothetical protein
MPALRRASTKERTTMTTAEQLSERASTLARSDSSDAEAITELLLSADGHRVSAVRARQTLAAESEGAREPGGDAARAVRLLQGVIDQMPL